VGKFGSGVGNYAKYRKQRINLYNIQNKGFAFELRGWRRVGVFHRLEVVKRGFI
jgi:hypothetical protein